MRSTIKKAAIAASTLLILSSVTAAATGSGWTERQTTAHEIAQMARELGLPEDNPIITEASRLWWEDEESKEPEPERVYLGRYRITGYDTCAKCCGKWAGGPTASGTNPTVGRTVAAKGLPFGTRIYIDGIGERIVEDRGCKSGVIDVLCANHAECYAITGYADVWEVVG